MATIPELSAKLDAIQSGVNDLKSQIAELKNQPSPVATQADLDNLGAKLDAISTTIAS